MPPAEDLHPRRRHRPHPGRPRRVPGPRGQLPRAERRLLRAGEPQSPPPRLPGVLHLLSGAPDQRLPHLLLETLGFVAPAHEPEPGGGDPHPRPPQLRLLRALLPGPRDGGLPGGGHATSSWRTTTCTCARTRGRQRGRRHLPARGRRLPRPARLPPRQSARACPGSSTPIGRATWPWPTPRARAWPTTRPSMPSCRSSSSTTSDEEPLLPQVPTYVGLPPRRLALHDRAPRPSSWSRPPASPAATTCSWGPSPPETRSRATAPRCRRTPATTSASRWCSSPPTPPTSTATSSRGGSTCGPSSSTATGSGCCPAGSPGWPSGAGSYVVNSSQGGGSKDTWVLAPRDGLMLSRVADALYWMGRYLERAENRHPAAPGDRGHRLPRCWGSTRASPRPSGTISERIFPGPEMRRDPDLPPPFFAFAHLSALLPRAAASVLAFIVSLRKARENARAVREALTVEVFVTLNDTWRDLETLHASAGSLDVPMFRDALSRTQRGILSTVGAIEHTLTRDQGWLFLKLGEALERVLRTATVLRAKLPALLAPEPKLDLPLFYTPLARAPAGALVAGELPACVRRAHRARRGPAVPPLRRASAPRSLRYGTAAVKGYLDRLAEGDRLQPGGPHHRAAPRRPGLPRRGDAPRRRGSACRLARPRPGRAERTPRRALGPVLRGAED